MTGEPDGHEEVLVGGNMTAVVRVGDTVRRAAGPWTPTIHAFMRHLRAAGFEMVPEPLGIDDRGREVISFLPGAPATYPPADFVWSETTLSAVARSLRAFHDASLGFVPPANGCWQAYTAYRFVPLTDPANPDAPFPGADAQARRLAAFCAAYGEPGIELPDVLASAAAKLRELVAFIERQAAAGDPAQQAVLARGDVLIYRRDIAHIERLDPREYALK